jgi:predicted amidohydrolase
MSRRQSIMRVAVYQCESRPGDVAGNLDRLARAAEEAAGQGAELLISPEMFLTGYNIGRAAVRRMAEPPDGDSARAVSGIARRHGLAVVYGYPEAVERDGEPETVFNAVQLIDREGASLVNYRKTHLFGDLDRGMFAAGRTQSPIVELNGWRVGMLICYDTEFPETSRQLAVAGADIIVAPTANMHPFQFVADTLVPARAYENRVYLAYVNYCGAEGEIEYCGRSCIAGPDGTDAARAGSGEELVVGELDHARMESSRAQLTYLADRRPELY